MYRYVALLAKLWTSRRSLSRSCLLKALGTMANFRSHDDPVRGSPHAHCLHDDSIRSFAPASCTPLPGAYPAVYVFHRHDYAGLSLALAAPDDSAPPDMSLDLVFYGTHTLRWPSMHEILRTALVNGFVVPQPNDFTTAVLTALSWSESHQSVLRRIIGGRL